jgi:hypothetical protein
MTVELLNELLRRAVAERQSLRERGAGEAALERNRLLIVDLQWQLSWALVARYIPQARAAA